jgi:hypothetical protein
MKVSNQKINCALSGFSLSSAVQNHRLKKIYWLLGSVLLSSQLLGLIFCGDAACLQGGSDESCTTLLCGLLAKHTSAPPTSDCDSDSCQCLCHLLIDLPRTNLQVALLAVAQFHIVEASQCFSTPAHDIDHPPLA